MYLENDERSIQNNRYIDTTKVVFNTRLLLINICGFKLSGKEKIQMILNSCERLSIDIILLNETNIK